jgi:hypothetical protein
MTDVLRQTGAGVHVQSKSELRCYLITAYRQFQRNGCVAYDGKEDAINRYTHVEMARKFAQVLNTAVRHRQPNNEAAQLGPQWPSRQESGTTSG